MSKPKIALLCLSLGLLAATVVFFTHPSDSSRIDATALPEVPAGFEVRVFAKEPLVGNPAALTFDAKGRLFVGMGPQYRNPTPDTPGDRVVILLDSDGDGTADKTTDFATGLNCIQGLAWHGRDLWIANAPDLTIARDLDGDDEADEYVRVFTDLGNLEHGLHGLIWGPDGKLYMTKGNSRGLTQSGHLAPKPFRVLWGMSSPEDAPDFSPPQTFKKGEYRHAYHDPNDDWGREGGFLRCDDLGANLEIVSRGLRNPFDIVFDSGFNWLGTDNDQHEGDRIVMPFAGAHFGWGHGWSAHWTGERNPPTVPISGPVFEGSGTGVVFYDAPQFPPEWRGVWLMNDWEGKRTCAYRPRWDGALMQPEGGAWKEFAVAGHALYRPTDMEIGPDGAVWVASWGRRFNRPQTLVRNVLGKTDELEGRIYRIAWKDAPAPGVPMTKRSREIEGWTFAEVAEDLGSHIPAWRVAAQKELLRRGPSVNADLRRLLDAPGMTLAHETWALWTLGRMDEPLSFSPGASLNRRIQVLRIWGERVRPLPTGVAPALRDAEPRVRFAAVQAIWRARDSQHIDALKELAATETDRVTFYSTWCALRDLAGADALRAMLQDPRDGVRRAAFLALADRTEMTVEEATAMVGDPAVTEVAALWLSRRSGNPFITFEPQPGEFEREVKVFLTPGLKPSDIRYTRDGSTPSEQSPIFPESESIVLRDTTTLRAALFVEGQQIGNAAEAVYTKSAGVPAASVVLAPRTAPTSVEQALAVLKSGHPDQGRAIFLAAGCVNCHRAGGVGRQFGPDLSGSGARNDPEHIVRSILEPNAAITEGFALLNVRTSDGRIFAGVLREETDLHLTLAQATGQPVRVDKRLITQRESLHTSPMPPYGGMLAPEQVASVVAWLMAQKPEPQRSALAH